MAYTTLSTRTFTAADQERFACASGDRNPMHVDPIAARRTQAGAPVVHGMHLLLWALDVLAAAASEPAPPRSVRVRFHQFLYTGESAALELNRVRPGELYLRVTADQTAVATIRITCGESGGRLELPAASVPQNRPLPEPAELAFEDMDGRCGQVSLAGGGALVEMFGHVAAWLGGARVAALGAATYLVGMVCPGLHSIFTELSVETTSEPATADALAFRVTATDSRFRAVVQEVRGGGWQGSITSLVRKPPVEQASAGAVAALVRPGEFSGAVALIVGGSRGLGEMTAKLIAAGGGEAIITFQRGSGDAERVAGEIRQSGGVCRTLRYDVLLPAGPQLAELTATPTHLYYFATPPIFRPQRQVFNRERFQDFTAFYVEGFWRLVRELAERKPDLSVFYPSSVALDARPAGLAEYAMAKAAGETLCADLNAAMAPLRVVVSRLPRLSTDQTAQVTAEEVETAPAWEILLPLIREMQRQPCPA